MSEKKAPAADLRVAILMGSKSDWEAMRAAVEVLGKLGVGCEARVLSAHRTPDALEEYVQAAPARGIRLFIAGAGGAAHLAGVLASRTNLPVLGVPMESKSLKGLDSLLSTVQMPGGIPVATFAIGDAGAKNAGIFAAQILALGDPALGQRLVKMRADAARAILETEL